MTPLKIHLGCGKHHVDGWVNCDLHANPNVDAAFDCQKTWPFPENSVGEVYASHMLEHLAEPTAFFQEAWRCLIPNGRMLLRLPYGGHRSAWWDVTHLRPWYIESFAFIQPGYGDAVGNPQHGLWQTPYGISTVDLRVAGRFLPILKRRWLRRLLVPYLDLIPEFGEELWAHVFALKRPADIAEYRRTHEPHTVPARYVMWRYQLEGYPVGPDEPELMVPIAELNAATFCRA